VCAALLLLATVVALAVLPRMRREPAVLDTELSAAELPVEAAVPAE
jgi:hypothetical protein